MTSSSTASFRHHCPAVLPRRGRIRLLADGLGHLRRGFFMRPVGGILLGMYADRQGRKAAMQLIIRLMTLAIALIAFAPDYAAIGLGGANADRGRTHAPGIRHGRGNTPALRLSWSNPRQRASAASMAPGNCSASAWRCSPVREWAHWSPTCSRRRRSTAGVGRLPFILGLLIGPLGLWMRRHLQETDEFRATRQDPRAVREPLLKVIGRHRRAVLVSMGMTIFGTASFYVILVHMPTFASKGAWPATGTSIS
ncbi:general substrate transporter [Pseudomonas aeruginosa]|nr:general substrate transporter [Pseudomonas aeruginosa]